MEDFSKFDETYLSSKKVYSEDTITLPESTPQSIKALYKTYGLASFGEGFLWILNPIEWQDHYLPWFEAIEVQEGHLDSATTYPFLRTAFGDVLYFCGKQLGFVSISTGAKNHLNLSFYLNVSFVEEDILRDLYFFGIFESFLSKAGIGHDECLGFLPPVALGGEISDENVYKVKLKEHLSFLSELLNMPSKGITLA